MTDTDYDWEKIGQFMASQIHCKVAVGHLGSDYNPVAWKGVPWVIRDWTDGNGCLEFPNMKLEATVHVQSWKDFVLLGCREETAISLVWKRLPCTELRGLKDLAAARGAECFDKLMLEACDWGKFFGCKLEQVALMAEMSSFSREEVD